MVTPCSAFVQACEEQRADTQQFHRDLSICEIGILDLEEFQSGEGPCHLQHAIHAP